MCQWINHLVYYENGSIWFPVFKPIQPVCWNPWTSVSIWPWAQQDVVTFLSKKHKEKMRKCVISAERSDIGRVRTNTLDYWQREALSLKLLWLNVDGLWFCTGTREEAAINFRRTYGGNFNPVYLLSTIQIRNVCKESQEVSIFNL